MKAKDSSITNAYAFIEDRKNYANKRNKKFRCKIHVYFYLHSAIKTWEKRSYRYAIRFTDEILDA